MSDACKIEPSLSEPCGSLNSKQGKSVIEPSERFEPLRQMQLAIPPPVLVAPAIPSLAPTHAIVITDHQILMLILILSFVLLCAAIAICAARG